MNSIVSIKAYPCCLCYKKFRNFCLHVFGSVSVSRRHAVVKEFFIIATANK